MNALSKRPLAAAVPRHRQDVVGRGQPDRLPDRKSDKSARDYFFYFSGATPSAVRYKNWKMYYNMSQPGAEGWILPLVPFHFTIPTTPSTRSR
jgi:hypothetical protein